MNLWKDKARDLFGGKAFRLTFNYTFTQLDYGGSEVAGDDDMFQGVCSEERRE